MACRAEEGEWLANWTAVAAIGGFVGINSRGMMMKLNVDPIATYCAC